MRISDWSSDVCSSDLSGIWPTLQAASVYLSRMSATIHCCRAMAGTISLVPWTIFSLGRSLASATSCGRRSEEHTSELQSLMRISYAVFCLKKKKSIHQLTESVEMLLIICITYINEHN